MNCRIDGCPKPTFRTSSLCLGHIKTGRTAMWNMLGYTCAPKRETKVDSYVYVVRGETSLKFGVSRSPQRRFFGLRCVAKESLRMVGYVEASKRMEAMLLAYLKPDRLHGEWFADTPRTRAVEDLICAGDTDALLRALRGRAA